MQKMFEVVCKCGHVGKSHYIPVAFAVKAANGKEAARIARFFPRVKHDHKDAILSVREIDYAKFLSITEDLEYDPYMHCSNIQEQNCIDLTERLIAEKSTRVYSKYEVREGKTFYFGKKKIRNPKKYVVNMHELRYSDDDICA